MAQSRPPLSTTSGRAQWLEHFSAVIIGAVIGLVILITAISYGALIFSGPLGAFRAQGISLAIISTIVSGIIFTIYSGAERSLPVPDDDTLPILALALSLIAASVGANSIDPDDVFFTTVAAITITTACCGIFFLLIGSFKLGGVVQYLPYSVIGGYFAGAGWLLLLGSMKVLLNIELDTLENVSTIYNKENLIKIGACLLVALTITILGLRFPKGVAIPIAMLINIVLFFVVARLTGFEPNELLHADWLIGPFSTSDETLSATIALEAVSGAHWQSVLSDSDSILTIIVLSAVSVLLTINGIDLLEEKELDINHELKVAGGANCLNSLFGGLISFHSFSIATLYHQLKSPKSRAVNITAILVCVAGLAFGLSTIQYFPRPVISGLLLYMGVAFMKEWLYEARDRFPLYEYLVIPLIFIFIILFGLIHGVAVGLIASVIIFVIKYSAIDIARYTCSGKLLSSNVERGPAEEAILQEKGDSLYISRLQGYLFFGTASRLYSSLVQRSTENDSQAPVRYAVYDCTQVTGLDSSAALSFIKMGKLASTRSFFFILAGLNDEYIQRLAKAGFEEDRQNNVYFLASMDHAVEWGENHLLSEHQGNLQPSVPKVNDTIIAQLSEIFPGENLNIFLSYFSSQDVSAGHTLCQQGGLSDEIFFIDCGEVSVFIETDGGERHRIRRTTVGAVFGELGFYLGTPRTATVIADTDSRILTMNAGSLKKMERDCPDLSIIFHQWMVRIVTRRLLNTTRTLNAVIQ